MTFVKPIAVLLATCALTGSLSGCNALDFLDIWGKDEAPAAATTSATAAAPASPAPVAAPATTAQPFDLSGALPAANAPLPASTLNASNAANAALLSASMGVAPSTYGGLTAGIPTTTTTTSIATYGAQPNPYAPRVPGSVAAPAVPSQPSAAFQQSLAAGLTSPAPVTTSSIYGTTYTPPATIQTQQVPVQVRAPSVAPLTAGLPSSAVTAINRASTSAPGQSIDPTNLSKSTITAIQTALKSRGLYSDVVDGVWGSKSKAAMSAYLASRGQASVTLDTLFSLGVSL